MKKLNLKLLICFTAILFGTFLMTACGDVTVTFNSQPVQMGLNQEIDLKDYVTVSGAEIENVVFESSNSQIVFVTSRYTLASGSVSGTAIITAKGYDGFLEVVVSGQGVSFSAPTNVHYDEITSSLVWDNVYCGQTVANVYKLNITCNNVPQEEVYVNTNSYEIPNAGDYSVTVECVARAGIDASVASDVYSFKKLSAPYNLEYNNENKMLTWECQDSYMFYVKKDGVLSDIVYGTSYTIALAIEQTYSISVISVSEEQGENVFGSQSEVLTLTRLNAPTIEVNSGVISWQDTQLGVGEYLLKIYRQSEDVSELVATRQIAYNGTDYTYTFENFSAGKYFVTVEAVGLNEQYLTSGATQTQTLVKLEAPSLLFNKELQEISVNNFDATLMLDLELVIEKDTQINTQNISQEGKLVYDFSQSGIYNFSLINKAKSADQISSNPSQKVTVVKLGEITTLTQGVDNQGNYVISGLSQAYANNFVVQKIFNNATTSLTLTNENYGLVNELFASAGIYTIKITASGNDAQNFYVIDGETLIYVERLQTVTLSQDEQNEKITWNKISDNSDVIFNYEITGETTTSGATTNTYLDYGNLPVGNYDMTVYSSSLRKTDVKTLILDAFTPATLNFDIYRQLATPSVVFARANDGYQLNITPVANANYYTVVINGLELDSVHHRSMDTLIVDITNTFKNVGIGDNGTIYNIEVYATNTLNAYYLQSENAEIEVDKIYAPTSFSLSSLEVITTTKEQNYIQDYVVLVNNVETNQLSSDVNEFNVKIKYIANVTNYNNVYYIDSDYSEFKLSRAQISVKAQGLLISWTLNNSNSNFSMYLNIQQGTNEQSIPLFNQTQIDLSKFPFETYGFDLIEGIQGNLQAKLLNGLTGEIAGQYENGAFVSGNKGELSTYYIGSNSGNIELSYANNDLNLQITEESNEINITWNTKTNCTYMLFDGTNEYTNLTQGQHSLDSTTFEEAKTYLMSLTQVQENNIHIYVFNVTRLQALEQLTITQDEQLVAPTQTGASKAVLVKDGQEIASVSQITGVSEVLQAKYSALGKANNYTFYLDSATVTYTFARLEALNITNNLKIYNNIVSWAKEGTAPVTAYEYVVKFFDNQGTEPHLETLTPADVNSFDLTTSKYQTILSKLSGTKYISIQKKVGEYVASVEEVNYLSSSYSQDIILKIINAPYNVAIKVLESDMLAQNELTISWNIDSTNVEIAGYIIKIENDGKTQTIETTGAYTVSSDSDLFKKPGVWTVSVMALGANDSISSNYSQSVSVTRLSQSANVLLNDQGTIAWGKVANANKYRLIYDYTDINGEIKTNAATYENSISTSDLFKTALNDEFSGIINLTLYATGDGTTTLSSLTRAEFIRLEKPEISFSGDKMIVENYENYPENTKIFVTATIDDNIVINKEVVLQQTEDLKYVWYIPTEFSYLNSNNETVIVDLSTQKDITFAVVAQNQNSKYIVSNKATNTLTLLSPLSNLRMVRDNTGSIHFMATNSNTNCANVTIKVAQTSYYVTGNVDFVVSDEIIASLGSAWKIEVVAVGSGTYLNSKASIINGTKLGLVNTITTEYGAVVWSAVNNATDYKMNIDNTIFYTGYGTTRSEKLSNPEITSGDHVIAIRAIGNITQTPISTGIILDGDYSSKYTVTKMPEISDLKIENGYFTFTAIADVSEYAIVAFSDLAQASIGEYILTAYTAYPLNNAMTYYHSPALNAKIDELGELYIKIYNKTLKENCVYSNYALVEYDGTTEDYIKVSRITNESQTVELYHPIKPDKVSLDYATTMATWTQNTKASNGYLISVDGLLEYLADNSYTIDANDQLAAGVHYIKYLQLGSTDLTEGRLAYLSADFTQELRVTKLNKVSIYATYTTDSLSELCLRYTTVSGANKYLTYVEDVYYREFSNSTTNVALTMQDLEADKVYSNFGMRAINSTDVTILASSMSYFTMVDSETQQEKVVKISKVGTPEQPIMKNGAFYWEFTDSSWLSMAQGYVVKKPFQLSLDGIFSQKFVLTFTSKTAPVKTYTYTSSVGNFVYMSDSQYASLSSMVDLIAGEQAETIKHYFNLLRYELEGGFASVNYGFNKFASNLPQGDYEIQVKLIGDGMLKYSTGEIEARFSSNFLNLGTKYVASAPSVTAVATNGLYTLEFNNVNVNQTYFSSAPTYSLIGVYHDDELNIDNEKEIATLTATGINNSELLSFNLTQLIQDGILDSTYTKLYVTVKGNNSNILNGKTSNVINITVLNSINSYVEHGVINWRAQDLVGKYQIVYTENGTSIKNILDVEVVPEQEIYSWLGRELVETKQYNVTLQACGLVDGKIKNAETLTMSGKITSIGSVTKLACINKNVNAVDISNGLFTWDSVTNASAYDVKYVLSSGGTEVVKTIYDTFYETEVTNSSVYLYYFMAIGTQSQELTDSSITYVNSEYSAQNQAIRLLGIESVIFKDGIIEFTPLVYTDYYKLTFYKQDANGEASEKLEVFTTTLSYDTNTNPSLLACGQYLVNVQTVYQNKTVMETDSNTYYLISQKAETSYYKFDSVYNISIQNGVISWKYDNIDNKNTNDYQFVLTFTTDTQTVTKTVAGNLTSYEGVVFEDILTSDIITLSISVYPSSTAVGNYVKSVATTYTNIHQYEKVDETKINISITEESQLLVDWSEGAAGSSSSFKYEVECIANGITKKFITLEPKFIAGENNDISFNLSGEYTLQIRIRVIPTIDNYISSAWTNPKEITRPQSVSNLTYDTIKQVLTWDKYEGSNNWDSYEYKIRDQVTYINSSGEEVTEIYILTANLADNSYTPFVIGTHILEVAVIVSNSNGDGFMSEYVGVQDAVFNLFASGRGTEEEPYVVSSETHFSNMAYRLAKDSKLNQYYRGVVVDGEVVLEETKTTDLSTLFFFKQAGHITLTKNGSTNTTLYVDNIGDFNNVYDGDFYSITFNYTHIYGTTDFAHVAIFKTLGSSAVIKNIKLLFTMSISGGDRVRGNNVTAHINVLSEYNYGVVSNVTIGQLGDSVQILAYSLGMDMSFVAWYNYGTITNVVNNYNVTIAEKNSNAQQQVQYAAISVNNYGTLNSVKNRGNINIDGTDVYVGGLVAYNQTSASITAGANSGNIDIYYLKSSVSYVGGLVAKNSNGVLAYTYNTGNITVNSATTCSAFVGGLIGWSEGDNISYSYANFTPNTEIANFNIYQIIGYLKSGQNKASYVYYKQVSGFVHVNGSAGTGFKAYVTSPAEDGVELYGSSSLFNRTDVDVNGNPKLSFEAAFEAIQWKEID